MSDQKPLVEWRQISALKPYARNAKKHSEAHVAQIARSISQFGWTMPMLVDEHDGIAAGHGRELAAAKIYADGGTITMVGGTPVPAGCVPVIVARGWSEQQKRAYVLADNKIPENGEWDADILKQELIALQSADFDVSIIGFEERELVTFFAGGGDAIPPESNYSEQYGVIVLCTSEAEQKAMYDRLIGEGLSCKVVTT